MNQTSGGGIVCSVCGTWIPLGAQHICGGSAPWTNLPPNPPAYASFLPEQLAPLLREILDELRGIRGLIRERSGAHDD